MYVILVKPVTVVSLAIVPVRLSVTLVKIAMVVKPVIHNVTNVMVVSHVIAVVTQFVIDVAIIVRVVILAVTLLVMTVAMIVRVVMTSVIQ